MSRLLFFFCVTFAALPNALANETPGISSAVEQVDKLAKCSATQTTNIMILRAARQDAGHLEPVAEWFFDAAVALSDVETTKERFKVHYAAYLAANDQVAKADRAAQATAARSFFAALNRDLGHCDLLKPPKQGLSNPVTGTP